MEGYCRAVPAVGGLELGGRLVSEAAAGILGHDTVNMPSLRLALTSDSYIIIKTASQSRCLRPSGIRTARRKDPKRSSCIGINNLGS